MLRSSLICIRGEDRRVPILPGRGDLPECDVVWSAVLPWEPFVPANPVLNSNEGALDCNAQPTV